MERFSDRLVVLIAQLQRSIALSEQQGMLGSIVRADRLFKVFVKDLQRGLSVAQLFDRAVAAL